MTTMTKNSDQKIQILKQNGVVIIDHRQVYISDDVDLSRICTGVVLYPGTRITGSRSYIGNNSKIGTEGGSVLVNCVLGESVEVSSGYLDNTVLLRKSKVGANGHLRPGTLLEEEASTAHCVGLKHTILMSYVTLGSLINFCDGIISGGRSRKDHSEIGSGFIHFNFTPWGEYGDKATASLVGNVVDGVFLNQDKIFLGGMSGIVGPVKIGFGSFAVAGQIIRSNIEKNTVVSNISKNIKKRWVYGSVDALPKRTELNIQYISQLIALKAWYAEVRLIKEEISISGDNIIIPIKEAIKTLDVCIDERVKRLNNFLKERGEYDAVNILTEIPNCPLDISTTNTNKEYTDWVKSLPETNIHILKSWLTSITKQIEHNLNHQLKYKANK